MGSDTKGTELNSLWTGKKSNWQNSIGWNDNRATFKAKGVRYATKYGSFFNNQNDTLFQNDDVPRGNVQMVYGYPNALPE